MQQLAGIKLNEGAVDHSLSTNRSYAEYTNACVQMVKIAIEEFFRSFAGVADGETEIEVGKKRHASQKTGYTLSILGVARSSATMDELRRGASRFDYNGLDDAFTDMITPHNLPFESSMINNYAGFVEMKGEYYVFKVLIEFIPPSSWYDSEAPERKIRNRDVSKIGDTIRVTDGPFNDFSGKITSKDETGITTEVSIFGRTTPVELRYDQFELE